MIYLVIYLWLFGGFSVVVCCIWDWVEYGSTRVEILSWAVALMLFWPIAIPVLLPIAARRFRKEARETPND